MATDLSNPALYDQASVEQKLQFLNSQLGTIGAAAMQAKARGDTVDLGNDLVLFRQLVQQAADLTQQVNAAQAPSAFAMALSNFSDQAVSVASGVGGAFVDLAKELKDLTDAALKGTTLTVKFLPWVLLLVAVGIVAIFIRAKRIGAPGVSVSR